MTEQNKHQPWLGCIADDYTGATDLASFLVASGLRTLQINGLSELPLLTNINNIDAVVIAIKSRTIAVNAAIEMSLSALNTLQTIGCKKFYFKYCSTFDSTATGNIGPVVDALMSALNVKSTIICPALPVNGRTVYQGNLFVFDQPLHESPMKDHPLTPMRDSSILRMIEQQGKGKAISVPYSIVEQGTDTIKQALISAREGHQYIVVDALKEQHLLDVGQCLADFPLITGGSGLAYDLSQEFVQQGGIKSNATDTIKSFTAPSIVLSGSCSAMTQKQVADYRKNHPVCQLNIEKLVKGEQSVSTLLTWLASVIEHAPLITATAAPEEIINNQQTYGAAYIAELVEQTLSSLALEAKNTLNVRNFVVAGGETSGAVVNALQANSFYIGKNIAPGVPMVQTTGEVPLNLALKSGNFGDPQFFTHAIEILSCC